MLQWRSRRPMMQLWMGLLFLTTMIITSLMIRLYPTHPPSTQITMDEIIYFNVSRDQQPLLNQNQELDHDFKIPNNVVYFWCGPKRHFEFRHFLSIQSVFRYLHPYRVTFYYEYEPTFDELGYNTWLSELVDQYPFFVRERVPSGFCVDYRHSIDEYLIQFGGIYIREDVIIARPIDEHYRMLDFVAIDEKDSISRLVQMSSRRYKSTNISTTPSRHIKLIRGGAQLDDSQVETGKLLAFLGNAPAVEPFGTEAVDLEMEILLIAENPIFPEFIWELDSSAGRLLRAVAYNKVELALPEPDYEQLSPNIAHVVWTDNDPMPFNFYLCALSLIYIVNVDVLYIHGDGPPSGQYWNLLKNHPKIHLVLRTVIDPRFERIYGNKIRKLAHITDVWRADIMYRYGGLYADTDVMFVRPLSKDIRAYDAVLSHDISQRGFFPGSYQNGVMLGKPGAEFWRLFLESMKIFIDTDWLWNSCFQTYKIKERHPQLLHIDPHLNTICANYKCYPSWMPGFMDIRNDHIKTGSMKHWQIDAYGIHHTEPSVPELDNHKVLLENNGTTLFGEVGLFVLQRAGMLDYFRKLSV